MMHEKFFAPVILFALFLLPSAFAESGKTFAGSVTCFGSHPAYFQPLSFYSDPYFHSELFYREESKAISVNQFYNDVAVIESYANIVCRK
jgi:hypothetical protein